MNENPLDPNDLVCAGKLALKLGISRPHVYSLLRDGNLPQPCFRIGRSPRWSLSEVVAFLRNREESKNV